MKTIIVVGAGASGLLAAGQSALLGAKVLLFEKMEEVGKKMLICGKGRCNISNDSDLTHFLSHYNRSGKFLRQAFSKFFIKELTEFFTSEGVELTVERGGRIFPKSGKAKDIVAALASWAKNGGVQLYTNTRVEELIIDNGKVKGVIACGKKYISDGVIISTGGASYPATGSTGEGYQMAQKAGHSLVPLRPALVPLIAKEPDLKRLAGLDLKNVELRIFIGNKRKKVAFGEVGFSHVAMGGPLTLTHSLYVIDALAKGEKVHFILDLKPALSLEQLDKRLQRDLLKRNKEKLSEVLRGLLPQKLVIFCLIKLQLDGKKIAGTLTAKERKRIVLWLKNFRIDIANHRPLKEAMVTAGGVPVKEVNPNTMESLLVKNLYFTGEVLDINGETGGYNLQAAFSTGWVAGSFAAASN